jgi:DNA replication protein DnaC
MSSSVQQTIAQLRQLKLAGMVEAYEAQLAQPKTYDLPFDDRAAMMVQAEIDRRERKRLENIMKKAAFPEKAFTEDFDNEVSSRGIDKKQFAALASCEWLHQKQNLIFTGPTGTGKTWLMCAVGSEACRRGYSVRAWRADELCQEVAVAIGDGTLPELKQELTKPAVLAIDDFSFGEVSRPVGQVLLNVFDRRMKTGSLMITSQPPVEHWHEHFTDPTQADAILDRIVHQAIRISLAGESLRKHYARKKNPRS